MPVLRGHPQDGRTGNKGAERGAQTTQRTEAWSFQGKTGATVRNLEVWEGAIERRYRKRGPPGPEDGCRQNSPRRSSSCETPRGSSGVLF